MVVFLILLAIGFGCVTFFSLQAERDHLESCKRLGLTCEPGRIQQLTDDLLEIVFDLKKKVMKNLD